MIGRPGRRGASLRGAALTLAVFGALLVLRLASASIINDDYLHLALAQQVLLGDVPVRDFIDPGELLFNYASAGAQLLLGRTVLSEVLLDAAALSLGQALLFVLASRASGSRIIGLLVTAMAFVLVTRLYSYPKIVLYAIALALLWRYADDRRLRTLLLAAACTAIAFLFRHDHGACIGAATGVLLALAHWGDAWTTLVRRLAVYGGTLAVLILPFFVFLQVNGAGISYWRNMIETGRAEYQRTVGPYPPVSIDVGGILPLPMVGPDGLDVLAWFYYLTILLPPLTLVVLAADGYRRSRTGVERSAPLAHEGVKMTTAAVLAALTHLFLLRAASDSAIADVSTLTAVLGAWILGRTLRPLWGARSLTSVVSGFSRTTPAAAVAAGGAIAVAVITAWHAFETEGGRELRKFAAGLADGRPFFDRLAEYRGLSAPFGDEGEQYVFACTLETDRVLVTSEYAPHAYYSMGRGFAAGRVYFYKSLGPSPELEAFSLRRLERQRVPLVVLNPDDYDAFAATFPSLHGYIRTYYRRVGEVEIDESPLTILADTRLAPVRTFGPRELPCFRGTP